MAIGWTKERGYYQIPSAPPTSPEPSASKPSGDSTASREVGSKIGGKEYVHQSVVKYYLTAENRLTWRAGGADAPSGAQEIPKQTYDVLATASSGQRVSAVTTDGKPVTVEKKGDIYLIKGTGEAGQPTQEIIAPPTKYNEAFFKDMPKAPGAASGTFLASEGFVALYKEREPEIQAIRQREAEEAQQEQLRSDWQMQAAGKSGFLLSEHIRSQEEKSIRTGEAVNIYGNPMIFTKEEPSPAQEKKLDFSLLRNAPMIGQPVSFFGNVLEPVATGMKFEKAFAEKSEYPSLDKSQKFLREQSAKLWYYQEKTGSKRPDLYGARFALSAGAGIINETQSILKRPVSKTAEYAAMAAAFYTGGYILSKIPKIGGIVLRKKLFTGLVIGGAVATSGTIKVMQGERIPEAYGGAAGEAAVPVLAIFGATKGYGLARNVIGGVKTKISRVAGFKVAEASTGEGISYQQVVPLLETKTITTSFWKKAPKPASEFITTVEGFRVADVGAKRTTQDISGFGKVTRTKAGLKFEMADVSTTQPEFIPRLTHLKVPEFPKVSYLIETKSFTKPYTRLQIKPIDISIREDVGFTESGIPIEGLFTKPKLSTFEYAQTKIDVGEINIETFYRKAYTERFGKRHYGFYIKDVETSGIAIKTGYSPYIADVYGITGVQSPYTALRHELFHSARPDITEYSYSELPQGKTSRYYQKKQRYIWEQEIEWMSQRGQPTLGRKIASGVYKTLNYLSPTMGEKFVIVMKDIPVKSKGAERWFRSKLVDFAGERKYPAPLIKTYPSVSAKDIPVKGSTRTRKRLITTAETPKPIKPAKPAMVGIYGLTPIERKMLSTTAKEAMFPKPKKSRVAKLATVRQMMASKKAQLRMQELERIQLEKPKFEKPNNIWSAEKFYRKGIIMPVFSIAGQKKISVVNRISKISMIRPTAISPSIQPAEIKPTTYKPRMYEPVKQHPEFTPIGLISQKQDITPKIISKYKFGRDYPGSVPEPFTDIPTGGGIIPPFSLADFGRGKKGSLPFKRKYKYAPDLASVAMNITRKGEVPKGKTIFSPAGLRPIIIR